MKKNALDKFHDPQAEKKNERMDHLKMDYSNHGDIPAGMAGYDHHKMMITGFRKRFWMSLIITIPILIFFANNPGFR